MLPTASPTKPAAVWPPPGLAALSPSAPPCGAAALSDMYGNRYCAAQKRAAVCSTKPAEPSTPKLLPTDAGRVALSSRPHIGCVSPDLSSVPTPHFNVAPRHCRNAAGFERCCRTEAAANDSRRASSPAGKREKEALPRWHGLDGLHHGWSCATFASVLKQTGSR